MERYVEEILNESLEECLLDFLDTVQVPGHILLGISNEILRTIPEQVSAGLPEEIPVRVSYWSKWNIFQRNPWIKF